MPSLRTVRAVTTRKLSALGIPQAFALASISAAAAAKGTPNDRRRNSLRARRVAALLEAAEQHGASTLDGQVLLLKAGKVAREGEEF